MVSRQEFGRSNLLPRQGYGNPGTFARFAVNGDAAAVQPDKFSRIVEPQTEPPDLAGLRRIDLIKFFKNLRQLFPVDADPVVFDGDLERPDRFFQSNGDLPLFPGELAGVVDQLFDGKGYFLPIEQERRQLFKIE